MKRSSDRILTTHVGSLVRTPEIVDAMRALENRQPCDEQVYERDLRDGVAQVVQRQARIGVDVPSDGEYGKRGWTQYVSERLGGLELVTEPSAEGTATGWERFPDYLRFDEFYQVYDRLERTNYWLPQTEAPTLSGGGGAPRWMCTGPITYQGQSAVQRDIANFKAALKGVAVAEAFMPVAAPCSVEANRTNRYYASEEAFLFAVADALKEEYRAIVDAGFLLQVDDAWLPMRYARMQPNVDVDAYHRWAQVRVDALNDALDGIPADRVRYHICWGSQNVPHVTDAPLRVVLPLLFKINAGAYSIEAANPQHAHEWQLWETAKLPYDRILIPGVISHATNIVEHPELVAWRLVTFARLVGRENVIGGTDCGFSQNWNLVRVHPQVQWAKLESLVEGAHLATKQLWGHAD